MTEFIIDTPYHKRWRLPDGKHLYNSVIFGDTLRLSIIEERNHNTKEVYTVSLSNPKWQDLSFMFQDLANKKYHRIR